jgi:hypothetical protein
VSWPGEPYFVAILCTRNGSPRGHFTLFLVLQYGQTALRSISFASPVDPTTRMPRWHFEQRKIFCNCPPCLACSARRSPPDLLTARDG